MSGFDCCRAVALVAEIRRHNAARSLLAELSGANSTGPKRVLVRRRAQRDLLRAGVDFSAPPEPLLLSRLTQGLKGRACAELRWGCPSTMNALHSYRGALPHFLLSEWQWSGRGRHDRRWQSPLSGNYYIGLAAELRAAPDHLPTLPLLLGVAVAEQLRALALPAKLKWPNDIVIDTRKLGGVLVELQMHGSTMIAHIGIGLNWRLAQSVRSSIDREVTDLSEHCARLPDRNALLLKLLHGMLDAVDALGDGATAQWLARWRALDSLHGQTLRVALNGGPLVGVADSVDAGGRLRLLTDQGLQLIDAGEVERVRPASARAL